MSERLERLRAAMDIKQPGTIVEIVHRLRDEHGVTIRELGAFGADINVYGQIEVGDWPSRERAYVAAIRALMERVTRERRHHEHR